MKKTIYTVPQVRIHQITCAVIMSATSTNVDGLTVSTEKYDGESHSKSNFWGDDDWDD